MKEIVQNKMKYITHRNIVKVFIAFELAIWSRDLSTNFNIFTALQSNQQSFVCFKPYPLWLGNISKDFAVDNMKKTGLNEYVCDFSVDYNIIDVSDFVDIYKYLIKRHNIKQCSNVWNKLLIRYWVLVDNAIMHMN